MPVVVVDPLIVFMALVAISVIVALIVVFAIYRGVKQADFKPEAIPSPVPKAEERRTQRLGIRRALKARSLVLIVLALIVYFILLMPYQIHVNLPRAGVVVYSESITIESLPAEVQDICRSKGFNPTAILLVEHVYPKWTAMIITSDMFWNDAVVEMSSYIVDWRVDWRDFNLVGQSFDRLAIANVKLLSPFESWIEKTLSSPLGGYLLDLSLVDFYAGPVLVVLCTTLLASKRLALWNVPAIWGFYSFQTWMLNMMARAHSVHVALEWNYFGYSFLGLLPLTIYVWHFERTEAGKSTAEKMRAISRFLGF